MKGQMLRAIANTPQEMRRLLQELLRHPLLVSVKLGNLRVGRGGTQRCDRCRRHKQGNRVRTVFEGRLIVRSLATWIQTIHRVLVCPAKWRVYRRKIAEGKSGEESGRKGITLQMRNAVKLRTVGDWKKIRRPSKLKKSCESRAMLQTAACQPWRRRLVHWPRRNIRTGSPSCVNLANIRIFGGPIANDAPYYRPEHGLDQLSSNMTSGGNLATEYPSASAMASFGRQNTLAFPLSSGASGQSLPLYHRQQLQMGGANAMSPEIESFLAEVRRIISGHFPSVVWSSVEHHFRNLGINLLAQENESRAKTLFMGTGYFQMENVHPPSN